ncbi:MAG: hypothetical protein Q9227_004393 [Pyrenula ochraceoflavens]
MSTATDNLTEKMASASLNDTNTATDDKVAASAAEGRRLYIGNLAYATTEGELKTFFNGYDIESVSIPVNPRTTRPVGYAFVDLKSAEDAQKAITELSGKDVSERKVSVQLARKPEASVEKTDAVAAGENAEGGEPRKRGTGRGRGRGRARGGRVGRNSRKNTGDAGEGTIATTEVQPLTDVTNEANKGPLGESKDAKARGPRTPRQRGPPEDGVPSKTKVMVANLPYDLREDKLKELFSSYEPTSAKIALRPIPRFMVKKLQARNEPRKGRGFGFVTLGSESLQEKAVAEMNGKEIEGREIAVKVAIDSPGKEDDIEGVKENGVEEAVAA